MKKASGFYADSLEMLLDTMCNMLGAVVFIALMVALLTRDSTAPPPAENPARESELSNELAGITASNAVIKAELNATLLRLQDPHMHTVTNQMRLPNLTETVKLPWPVIVQYGKLYPLELRSTNGRGAIVRYNPGVTRQPPFVEARPGLGWEPEQGVADMVQSFKASGKTNYYFEFLVFNDSFPAFTRAREEAVHLGFEYGWKPLSQDQRLQLGPQGERIPPQN